MEIKSILIKDTTREERIRIIQEGLNQCGGACDFCNGCDNLGGGSVDTFYEPYINGEKELRQLNEEYRSNISFNTVLLPQPLGPVNATNSPFRIIRL